MRFVAAIAALACAAAAAAQVTIQVGASSGNVFVFTPSNVTAPNGTVVTFEFTGTPGNHSVTQSGFTDPCNPLANGFDSGWVFVPPSTPSTSTFPTWNLTIVNDTKPLWFFCKQLAPSPHCDVGMVGSINAATTGNNTFEAFQAAAKAHTGPSGQGIGLLVGQGASASGGPVGATGSFVAVGVPTATAPTSAGSATSTSASGSSSGSASAGAGASSSAAAPMAASALMVVVGALFGVTFA